jgi:uncharacterized protein (DUF2252 family)
MTELTEIDNFDWVRERSACSLAKAYEVLKLQIQQDVDTRKAIRSPIEAYRFSILVNGDSFAVLKEGNKIRETVIFALTDKAIEVRDKNHDTIFEATVTLSDGGKCRLMVGGQEREFWHVRKIALEKLFFGD